MAWSSSSSRTSDATLPSHPPKRFSGEWRMLLHGTCRLSQPAHTNPEVSRGQWRRATSTLCTQRTDGEKPPVRDRIGHGPAVDVAPLNHLRAQPHIQSHLLIRRRVIPQEEARQDRLARCAGGLACDHVRAASGQRVRHSLEHLTACCIVVAPHGRFSECLVVRQLRSYPTQRPHLRQSLAEARQADASDVAERTFHFMSVGVVDV